MYGIVDAAALAELAPPTTDDAQNDVTPPLRGLLLLLPHPQRTPGVTFAREGLIFFVIKICDYSWEFISQIPNYHRMESKYMMGFKTFAHSLFA